MKSQYLLKSRLLREEALRLSLIISLAAWALGSTAWALSLRDEVILISLSEGRARLVSDRDEELERQELLQFVSKFLETFYQYSNLTYEKQMSISGDMMSTDLWEREKEKYKAQAEKLKENPLSQKIEILAVDEVSSEQPQATSKSHKQLEVRLKILIERKLEKLEVPLTVLLSLNERARSKESPWGYEITEIRESHD